MTNDMYVSSQTQISHRHGKKIVKNVRVQ